MKQVVSISLGSSERDHKTAEIIGGIPFSIERIGTDGNKKKAIQLIRELDGKVDAFGLGGTDLYIYAGNTRYTFRESAKIAAAAKQTPIVDGSGLKNTLERRVIQFLKEKHGFDLRNKSALVVCAVDRFGLAEALVREGCHTVFGDIVYGLGLPVPIHSLAQLNWFAKMLAPVITKLPIRLFYPVGSKQTVNRPRFASYFNAADIIAGDFHFIRRNMPEDLYGKVIITNTVTKADEQLLRERGVATLVTTTPDMGGRSFGTNTLEGVLVALAGKRPEQLAPADYESILDTIGLAPRVTHFSL